MSGWMSTAHHAVVSPVDKALSSKLFMGVLLSARCLLAVCLLVAATNETRGSFVSFALCGGGLAAQRVEAPLEAMRLEA